MGWNWLWYFPLALISLATAWLSVIGGIRGIEEIWHCRTWWLLISPALWLWVSSVCASITAPLAPLVALPPILTSEAATHRGHYVVFSIAVAVGVFAVASALWWGSFPVERCIDAPGLARLRYIPFIPWPCAE